ncbi:uncharacterized protein LOC121511739%2C partial [Xyrichtys novacula]|uniref:Uncharacterized protein LOC121511739, partial n=1 Tax=Xyrichtys novacula TaxID=13765 RepID=A0AAV1GLY0_XYRNO|nr:uncharacterized protein LOC121511739%2C partial [Xyrichtys novacula]
MGTRLQYSSARLRELVSHSIPHSITVIKSLCLLRRPRYVHRGSRRMFIYSDSAIPSITSVFRLAALPCHHNKNHVRTRYLRPLVCVDSQAPPTQPMSAASFMLLNAQSINNKPGLIHDIITERHIDICCICLDLAISDHHAITFSVPASRPGQRPKRTITYRNIKAYYSTLIGSQENHPRKLFSTVNKLLSPLPPVPASGDSDLCHRFLNFFHDKVDTIHQQLQTSTTCLHTPQLQDTAPSATCPPFTSFTPVDESLTT